MTATSVKILFFTCLLSEDHKAGRRARRTAKARSFLHQREQGPEEQVAERQQSLFLSPDGDKEGGCNLEAGVYPGTPQGHRRITPNLQPQPRSGASWDCGAERRTQAPQGLLPEKTCREALLLTGGLCMIGKEVAAPADLRQEAFRSEVPGNECKATSLEEDGLLCSLSHIAVPDPRPERHSEHTPERSQ